MVSFIPVPADDLPKDPSLPLSFPSGRRRRPRSSWDWKSFSIGVLLTLIFLTSLLYSYGFGASTSKINAMGQYKALIEKQSNGLSIGDADFILRVRSHAEKRKTTIVPKPRISKEAKKLKQKQRQEEFHNIEKFLEKLANPKPQAPTKFVAPVFLDPKPVAQPPFDSQLNEVAIVQNNFGKLDQTDKRLLRYVRSRYMIPPSNRATPYNFRKPKNAPELRSPTAFSKFVREFYNDKKNGTFLEAGAGDGGPLSPSHTLNLEKELGWNGVLIECNQRLLPFLKDAGRKAWLASVCISDTNHPKYVSMNPKGRMSNSNLTTGGENLEAVPLYSILASVGIKKLDFMLLDLEGAEIKVLRAFPFEKVKIKVLIMDVFFFSEAELGEFADFLKKRAGLIFLKKSQYDNIYVHKSFWEEKNSFDALTAEET